MKGSTSYEKTFFANSTMMDDIKSYRATKTFEIETEAEGLLTWMIKEDQKTGVILDCQWYLESPSQNCDRLSWLSHWMVGQKLDGLKIRDSAAQVEKSPDLIKLFKVFG